ncbi:tetratricopeptide repeat protein [bacterium]|nr:tetratricopeptide repeat protein [bacterium]
MSFSNEEKILGLEKILADDPSDYTGWFLLGRLYLEENRPADGAGAFARAVEAKPDYSAAWKQLGDAWRKAGDNEKALEAYRQGLAVAEANRDLQTVKELQVFLRKLTSE